MRTSRNQLKWPILVTSVATDLWLNLVISSQVQGFPLVFRSSYGTPHENLSFWNLIIDAGIGVGLLYLFMFERSTLLKVLRVAFRQPSFLIGLYIWAFVRVNFIAFSERSSLIAYSVFRSLG